MTRHLKLAAAAIAVASTLIWTLTRREAASRPAPTPAPVASSVKAAVSPPKPAKPAVASVKLKQPAGKKAATTTVMPAEQAKARGAGLREKGEALGGSPR